MADALEPSRLVAVVGAGAMGAGIAQIAAAAGHPVKLYDLRREAAQKAIGDIGKNFVKLADKGRMSQEAASAASARLTAAEGLADLAKAALVVEAIAENLDVKRKLFAQLEGIVGADCILATNTSSISITSIGAGLTAPRRLLGMHFFNPAPLMALVEVVSGLATDPGLAETIFATAAAWGKSPVHAKSTPGFIVNRVARPFYAEGLRLLTEQAADPATLDAVMRESGGFRMGPFELMDLIGHDVNFAVTQSVFQAYFNDPRFTPSLIQQELVNGGFLGRKSGRGFYDYSEGAAKPELHAESAAPPPSSVAIGEQGPLAAKLRARLAGSRIEIKRGERGVNAPLMEVGGAVVYLTDGRCAAQRAHELERRDVVLIDLALDYASATRIALAGADQCSDAAYQGVVGLLQAAGFAVTRLADIPGLAVMRTVAMLANEAADAVNQGVCSAQDADLAMQKGVNYPNGPLAWADAVGLTTIHAVLKNLAAHYGEDRYRVSPLIQRKVWTGTRFHD